MKSVLWIPAAVLCISTMLDAQDSSVIPVVGAHRPTIVAFFPNLSQTRSNDADSNEALLTLSFVQTASRTVESPRHRIHRIVWPLLSHSLRNTNQSIHSEA
jgi:hypothetical protein